jgi:hypothetical protein
MVVVVGVVVIVLGIAFFIYRIKVLQQQQQQQQQQQHLPSPPAHNDAPVMADVLIVPPAQLPVHDRTLEADAFLDQPTDPTAVVARAGGKVPDYKAQVQSRSQLVVGVANGGIDLPGYKDQVQSLPPTWPSTSEP